MVFKATGKQNNKSLFPGSKNQCLLQMAFKEKIFLVCFLEFQSFKQMTIKQFTCNLVHSFNHDVCQVRDSPKFMLI